MRPGIVLHDALDKWIKKGVRSHIKPTWKSLYQVLCLMDLDSLGNKIRSQLNEPLVDQHQNLEQRGIKQRNVKQCEVNKPKYHLAVFNQEIPGNTPTFFVHFAVFRAHQYVSYSYITLFLVWYYNTFFFFFTNFYF